MTDIRPADVGAHSPRPEDGPDGSGVGLPPHETADNRRSSLRTPKPDAGRRVPRAPTLDELDW